MGTFTLERIGELTRELSLCKNSRNSLGNFALLTHSRNSLGNLAVEKLEKLTGELSLWETPGNKLWNFHCGKTEGIH